MKKKGFWLSLVLLSVMSLTLIGTGVFALFNWTGQASMNVQCGSIQISSSWCSTGSVTVSDWAMGDVQKGGVYYADFTIQNNTCGTVTLSPKITAQSDCITAGWSKDSIVLGTGESTTVELTVSVGTGCSGGAKTVDYSIAE